MTLNRASASMEQQACSTYQYLGHYDDSERASMASTASLQGGGGSMLETDESWRGRHAGAHTRDPAKP
jgi:hypothetical protein